MEPYSELDCVTSSLDIYSPSLGVVLSPTWFITFKAYDWLLKIIKLNVQYNSRIKTLCTKMHMGFVFILHQAES